MKITLGKYTKEMQKNIEENIFITTTLSYAYATYRPLLQNKNNYINLYV